MRWPARPGLAVDREVVAAVEADGHRRHRGRVAGAALSTGRWQTQLRYASPNGCIRFSVYAGYATYFEVNSPYTGSSYLFARSPVYTYAGGYTYHLGWFKVIKVSF